MSNPFVVPEDPKERGAATKAYLQAERQRLRAAHQSGQMAAHVARAWADAAQVAIVALFEAAVARAPANKPPMALVALGSLGRRELSPYSDFDLAVISEDPDAQGVRCVADGLFYPLWDARVDVGHAVRSIADFARLVVDDATVRTEAVDWRPLAGDTRLLADLGGGLQRALHSSAVRRHAAQAVAEWNNVRSPATVYRLEPDIKTGPGGLREIHRVWWLARLLWKIESWHDLLANGLLDRHGLDVLAAGRDALLNMRLAMHFVVGRRQDQLRFDVQDEVASYLRISAGPGPRDAAGNLLETFYRHAKAVRTVTTRVLERCAEILSPAPRQTYVVDADGFDIFRGSLTLHRVDQFDANPLEIIRIFRVAQKLGVRLYVHARARIAEAAPRLINEELRGDRHAARLFMDILADTSDAGETLLWLHDLGVLERFMPEFAEVMGLAQRDLYHVHTVDAHLVFCAQRAAMLLAGKDETAPADMVELAQRAARPHVLVLATLMHDIGKGHGHGHSERGAIMARAAGPRLGLSEEDAGLVEFLVLEHLSMFKISQRRDMQDETLIAHFAETVGTLERLDLLYMLSYCDAVTTGPEAWTEWKAQLLRELYTRTRAALKSGVARDSLANQTAEKLARVVALSPQDEAALRALARRLVPRHLLSHRADLLLAHLRAVQQAEQNGAACLITPDARRGGWEVVLVAPDRPGLIADLAGVLAAWGVSVDAAYISGTTDNLAIDTFVVQDAPAFKDPGRQRKLADEMCAASFGKADYASRILERRRARAKLPSGLPTPETRIIFDLDAPAEATVVDMFAPDRVGLLHDVAQAIFNAGFSIALARVNTEGERAVDAFYLVNATSRQPLTATERAQAEAAIRRAVS